MLVLTCTVRHPLLPCGLQNGVSRVASIVGMTQGALPVISLYLVLARPQARGSLSPGGGDMRRLTRKKMAECLTFCVHVIDGVTSSARIMHTV